MFCRIIFKRHYSLTCTEPTTYYPFTRCLLIHNSSCILKPPTWAPASCLCCYRWEGPGQKQSKGEPVHTQEGGCQEGIHINLEEVTKFSYHSGSSAALKNKCLQHRGTDRGHSLLFLFVCREAVFDDFIWTILYDRCKQRRSILGKAKIPSLYCAQIRTFYNTAAIWVWGWVGGVVLRYYRNQGEGELSHK